MRLATLVCTTVIFSWKMALVKRLVKGKHHIIFISSSNGNELHVLTLPLLVIVELFSLFVKMKLISGFSIVLTAIGLLVHLYA